MGGHDLIARQDVLDTVQRRREEGETDLRQIHSDVQMLPSRDLDDLGHGDPCPDCGGKIEAAADEPEALRCAAGCGWGQAPSFSPRTLEYIAISDDEERRRFALMAAAQRLAGTYTPEGVILTLAEKFVPWLRDGTQTEQAVEGARAVGPEPIGLWGWAVLEATPGGGEDGHIVKHLTPTEEDARVRVDRYQRLHPESVFVAVQLVEPAAPAPSAATRGPEDLVE